MRDESKRPPAEREKVLQARSPEEVRRLEQLGRNIRAARARAGLRQDDAAHAASIAVAQYARTERGLVNLTALSLFKIARALNVGVDELFRDLQ